MGQQTSLINWSGPSIPTGWPAPCFSTVGERLGTMSKKLKPAPQRIDAVFIRKSTGGQDENGQIGNVRNMLATAGVSVDAENWFVGTVSRRKVKANAHFNRLIELVEADRIGTVYIETQDRWGTADRVELFTL